MAVLIRNSQCAMRNGDAKLKGKSKAKGDGCFNSQCAIRNAQWGCKTKGKI